jgi:hypothetical protein
MRGPNFGANQNHILWLFRPEENETLLPDPSRLVITAAGYPRRKSTFRQGLFCRARAGFHPDHYAKRSTIEVGMIGAEGMIGVRALPGAETAT